MKLRVFQQSIRIRLSPSEVAFLGKSRRLEQRTWIGPQESLTVALEIHGRTPGVRREDGGEVLVVRIPEAPAAEWVEGKTTGVTARVPTGGEDLTVVVETDLRP